MREQARNALDEYAARIGIDVADVVAEVENTYGEPELIAAVGSTAAGLGTRYSDFDFIAVIDRDDVPAFPVTAFVGGKMIDTEYMASATLCGMIAEIGQPFAPAKVLDAREWHACVSRLRKLSRLAWSAPMLCSAKWDDLAESLRAGPLAREMSQFWYRDAWRKRIVSEWLWQDAPLTACVRLGEAIVELVEAELAARGQFYFGLKWTPHKASRSMDPALIGAIEFAQRFPSGKADLARFHSHGIEWFHELTKERDEPPLRAHLSIHPKAAVHDLGGEWMLSRDGCAGAFVKGTAAPAPDLPVWSGGSFEEPPPWVMSLFRRNLLWLGVSTGERS